MYSYNISKIADDNIFIKTCNAIENNCEDIYSKEPIIEDVDGSKIQIYNTIKGKITIFNDYEVDAVYIDSEIYLNDKVERI